MIAALHLGLTMLQLQAPMAPRMGQCGHEFELAELKVML